MATSTLPAKAPKPTIHEREYHRAKIYADLVRIENRYGVTEWRPGQEYDKADVLAGIDRQIESLQDLRCDIVDELQAEAERERVAQDEAQGARRFDESMARKAVA